MNKFFERNKMRGSRHLIFKTQFVEMQIQSKTYAALPHYKAASYHPGGEVENSVALPAPSDTAIKVFPPAATLSVQHAFRTHKFPFDRRYLQLNQISANPSFCVRTRPIVIRFCAICGKTRNNTRKLVHDSCWHYTYYALIASKSSISRDMRNLFLREKK